MTSITPQELNSLHAFVNRYVDSASHPDVQKALHKLEGDLLKACQVLQPIYVRELYQTIKNNIPEYDPDFETREEYDQNVAQVESVLKHLDILTTKIDTAYFEIRRWLSYFYVDFVTCEKCQQEATE